MKIMYFLAHPDGLGGASKVLMKQAHIMLGLGHQVCIIIQNDSLGYHNENFDSLCKEYGLYNESLAYPVATSMEDIDILASLQAYEEVMNLVKKYQPDVIHSMQLNIVVELVARALNIAHIMNVYPMTDYMCDIQWMNVYPKYHSADTKLFCRKWGKGLGIESRCIRIAYNKGADYENISNKKHTFEIICIGVFTEFKRQLNTIKFIELCVKNGIDVHVDFLGNDDNSYGYVCKQYVEEHDLNKYVVFHGFIERIEPYLNNKDLLIHASEKESYPGVLVEAMANKIPALAVDAGGITELLIDGVNGFVIPNSSVQAIYDTFERFIREKENGHINELIVNAYNTYLTHHTENIIGQQLTDYYTYAIEENKKEDNFLKLKYQDVYSVFGKYADKMYSKFTKEKVWYLYHLQSFFDKEKAKKVLVWGAGLIGKSADEWIDFLNVDIVGYIDSNKTGQYCGKDIYPIMDAPFGDVDAVLVAVANYDACLEIMEILESKGMERNKSYFLMQNNPCL